MSYNKKIMESQLLEKLKILNAKLLELTQELNAASLSRAQNFGAILFDRLSLGAQAALVSLIGPTGAGKSHLFNYLAGEELSPSSYQRPKTMAPVLLAAKDILDLFKKEEFLPELEKREQVGVVTFNGAAPPLIFLAEETKAPWPWPSSLALCDTPDFDSVLLANQALSEKLLNRSDAVILVLNPAKYADDSIWQVLAAIKEAGRPALIVLNRLNNVKLEEDLQKRLSEAGYDFPEISWPDENSLMVRELPLAQKNLIDWLGSIGRKGAEFSKAELRRCIKRFVSVMNNELLPELFSRLQGLDQKLQTIESVSQAWQENPQNVLYLNLPGETKKALEKGLEVLVSKADLWAAPRRLLAKPFALLKNMFRNSEQEEPTQNQELINSLTEVSREALVVSVRKEARQLRALVGLEAAPDDLDLNPAEIRQKAVDLEENLKNWLTMESQKIMESLPLGKKAFLYFVQFTHASLVVGLQIHLGGLPGTETLLGGALGPVLSKLSGVAVSREMIIDFEKRVADFQRENLGLIFKEQACRYQDYLKTPLASLASVPQIEALFKEIKKELEALL